MTTNSNLRLLFIGFLTLGVSVALVACGGGPSWTPSPGAAPSTSGDGEALTLALSSTSAAVPTNAEATGTIRVAGSPAPLTASFESVPESHDGTNTFSFGLAFSENVDGLSYRTLLNSAFTLTGGSVKEARRKTQDSNQNWEIHVEPDGTGPVSITLPAGAVSTSDKRSLQAAVSATVAGAALTASFENVPGSHDGGSTFSFDLAFSEDVGGLSYATLLNVAFTLTGGSVKEARRKTQGRNQSWEIHVEPDGTAAVSITLPAGAVSASDNRSLSAEVSATVAGPAGRSPSQSEEVYETLGSTRREYKVSDSYLFRAPFSPRIVSTLDAHLTTSNSGNHMLRIARGTPFSGTYSPANEVSGWNSPNDEITWPSLLLENLESDGGHAHNIALAYTTSYAAGENLNYAGYGWWAVAPESRNWFRPRILTAFGGLSLGNRHPFR